MSQFGVGKFKTAGGYEAIVTKLTHLAGEWILVGVLRCPVTEILHICRWTLNGISLQIPDPRYNLSEDLPVGLWRSF